MLWGTGDLLRRVKVRVNCSMMFFISLSNVCKLSTPHDRSFGAHSIKYHSASK